MDVVDGKGTDWLHSMGRRRLLWRAWQRFHVHARRWKLRRGIAKEFCQDPRAMLSGADRSPCEAWKMCWDTKTRNMKKKTWCQLVKCDAQYYRQSWMLRRNTIFCYQDSDIECKSTSSNEQMMYTRLQACWFWQCDLCWTFEYHSRGLLPSSISLLHVKRSSLMVRIPNAVQSVKNHSPVLQPAENIVHLNMSQSNEVSQSYSVILMRLGNLPSFL